MKTYRAAKRENLALLLFFGVLVFGGTTVIILQLVSPIPPFMDVLEVNAAPVHRVVAFSQFDPFSSNPSGRFAANRNFPGYIAFFSYLTATTGASAVATIESFMLLGFFLLILSVYFLGRNLGGSVLAAVAAWLFILSFEDVRSQDVSDRHRP